MLESKKNKDAKSKELDKKPQKQKVCRTAQQSIPYLEVYPNGMFLLDKGLYSKSYYLGDANFATESEDKQNDLIKKYSKFLNKFGHEAMTQVTILNRKLGISKISEQVKLPPKADNHQDFRDEYNEIIMERLKDGNNDISRERYFTVTLKSSDVIMANRTFELLNKEIDESVKQINKSGAAPLSTEERLHLLYDIYRMGESEGFDNLLASYKDEYGHLSLPLLHKRGMTTKSLIAPGGIVVKPTYTLMGANVTRSYIVSNLPASLDTKFLAEITNIPCVMIASLNNTTLPRSKALKIVKQQANAIKGDMAKKSKNAAKEGIDPSLISEDLQYMKEEASYLMQDLSIRNQKAFFSMLYITLIAEDMDELKKYENILKMRVSDFMCQITMLTGQQMLGFNSSLPFARSFVAIDYMLTSESICAFFPFSVQELLQKGGHFYGINDVTKNMLVYNRRGSNEPHGLILGKSGSGKSYFAKGEIIPNLLDTDDDIIIIDPDGEYVPTAMEFGGTVYNLALGSDTHINPLDMDINYDAGKGDPIATKLDALVTICESITGSRDGLDSYSVNVIHKCGRKMYEEYMDHMQQFKGSNITCDAQASPTLLTFWNELIEMDDPYAHQLAQSIEQYCKGSYDIFAHRTNVDSNARMVVYNLKELPKQMRNLAMQVCFSDIWNRVVKNQIGGKKHTWIYIDEFYLLIRTEAGALTMQEYYKRMRKYGGIMTAMTQDIEDVLSTPEGRGILNNTGFVVMMNQSQIGRALLQEQYQISDSLLEYVKERTAGQGLLWNGRSCIPFDYKLPTNTKLHKLMSTKFGE